MQYVIVIYTETKNTSCFIPHNSTHVHIWRKMVGCEKNLLLQKSDKSTVKVIEIV